MSCGMQVPGTGLLCGFTGRWAGAAAPYVMWNVSTWGRPIVFLSWALGWSIGTICHVECKYLGQAYCVVVLGLGLEQQHHMSCGM